MMFYTYMSFNFINQLIYCFFPYALEHFVNKEMKSAIPPVSVKQKSYKFVNLPLLKSHWQWLSVNTLSSSIIYFLRKTVEKYTFIWFQFVCVCLSHLLDPIYLSNIQLAGETSWAVEKTIKVF